MSSRLPSRQPLPFGFGPPLSPGLLPPLPRYRVILHRATDKGLLFVVQVVRELTRFAEAEAFFRMWDAHQTGRSEVVVTHLERAELFVEQFADRGLAATIEPA